MDDREIERILERTFEDFRLSRSEKQAFSQVLADHNPTGEQLARYRNTAFSIARKAMTSPASAPATESTPGSMPDSSSAIVLKWLEGVIKVLAPFGIESECSESRAYFSSVDNCTRKITDLIDGPHKQIDICVFTITHDHIANAIVRAHKRGTKVRIVTDRDKAEDLGSDIYDMQQAGVPIRLDNSRHHMHHKFALFDQAKLLTGSFNWTRSAANHNDENVIITDDHGLVRDFANEFNRLWNELA
jgi:mitochondrial cardiolipin hydrolase